MATSPDAAASNEPLESSHKSVEAEIDTQTTHEESSDTAPEETKSQAQEEEDDVCGVLTVPRVARTPRAPRRRVVSLMDRFEQQDGTAKKEEAQETEAAAARRRCKRRLDEAGLEPVPSRPGLGRSMSSHSVFLTTRPKMTLSTASTSASFVDVPLPEPTKPHELVLPTIRSRNHPDLNVISPQTVADLLRGVYDDGLSEYSLIDCRFDYEHRGGSLQGAMSLNKPDLVEERFLRQPVADSTRVALIFFCEFSANRAPKMLRHLRNLDRWIHAERYPELFYPELYLIDGGYKNCFETLKGEFCSPREYVPMSDNAYTDQCKREFTLLRSHWREHKTNACAAKFQQLHRVRVVADDVSASQDDDYVGLDLPSTNPVTFRSFSQQL
ncbi:hypothetical protein Poli38472_010908 [Pythium oligandrum]|uniref:M-phase inducer phosphatase n=1 Tax=Pythium oligandrum TaxID=41045 RepID=A0A8K1FFN1_PYTOL|nr:hypothetical protein Poli38472_010908 [Pythium oligandrum]|eukprot:TMW61845.1 hypothetical protein Poli38472_010908 [Pythium oligandrum]